MERRQFIQATVLGVSAMTVSAWAQTGNWPDKPIKLGPRQCRALTWGSVVQVPRPAPRD